MFTPEVFYGIGAAVLLLALGWGLVQNKRRNRRNDPITEAATRAEYSNPETYGDAEKRFKDQIHPS